MAAYTTRFMTYSSAGGMLKATRQVGLAPSTILPKLALL